MTHSGRWVEGGCLCGSVRYRAQGEPTNATLCHCRTCRKASGAPIVAWVTFPANGFSFVAAKPVEFRSSAKVIRTFCGKCGTPLTYTHADSPSGTDVSTCSLDDPEAFAPADHTWVSHRLGWVRVGDHLPAYPETREESSTHRERQVVEFFFSPGSRYSYLAASQMPSLEAETGCTVEWCPVNGADIRRLRGRDPFAGEPVSGQYDWDYRRYDAELWADHYGIPFREPPSHDFDFELLARAAMASKRLGVVSRYGWRLCSAVYGSRLWPIDESVCLRIAEEVGVARADFASALADPETRRLLAAAAAEACARGAFGVPTFFLGSQMFWGNDRIVILRHVLSPSIRG